MNPLSEYFALCRTGAACPSPDNRLPVGIAAVVAAMLWANCGFGEEALPRVVRFKSVELPNLPVTPFNYQRIDLPDHLRQNALVRRMRFQSAAFDDDNTPVDNPITDHGATLGRVLFYDKDISANSQVSCSSCHIQSHGFSDPRRFSLGLNGEPTRRHSMGLTNARFFRPGRFFWDERAPNLEAQVLMPIQDKLEMGQTLERLKSVLSGKPFYPPLFARAFGDRSITVSRIAKALAQFVRSIVSVDSRYDRGRAMVNGPRQPFPNFTASENLGKEIFFGQARRGRGPRNRRFPCVGCHVSEAFLTPPFSPDPRATTSALNNGLDATSTRDLGVGETTGNPRDHGKFKVPSLRNIAIRPPYMHDGRFATLKEVLEHYSSGIKGHRNLHRRLRNRRTGEPRQMNFSAKESSALISFLMTLTDRNLLTAEKFSDPFRTVSGD